MRPPDQSILESRLAAVLMGELLAPRQDLDDTFVDIILEDLELEDLDDPDDYYAAFEVIQLAAIDVVHNESTATTEFVRVRDTSRDHIITVPFPRAETEKPPIPTRFPRATPDAGTPVPQVSVPYERIDIAEVTAGSTPYERIDIADVTAGSTPYERIDIADHSAQFTAGANAMPFPLYSAPFERVDLDALATAAPTWPAEPTEVITAPTPRATRMIAMIAVLICALAFGIGLVLLVM